MKTLQERTSQETLGIGQVVWLNGYGQDEHYHERQAIYKVEVTRFGVMYHTVNLETFRTDKHQFVSPASKLFGIGIYYTSGDTVSQEEIEAALAKTDEVEAEDKRKAEEAAKAKAIEEQRIVAEWSGILTQMKPGEHNTRVVGAKNIRKELKTAFPGCKFSVKGKSFSGGDEINVSWTDGPTVDEVEDIIKKYQQGYFDGMEDLYIYGHSAFTAHFGGAKFVFANRSFSEAFRAEYRGQVPADLPEYKKDQELYRILRSISR